MEFINFAGTNTKEISFELKLRMHRSEIYYHLFSPWADPLKQGRGPG